MDLGKNKVDFLVVAGRGLKHLKGGLVQVGEVEEEVAKVVEISVAGDEEVVKVVEVSLAEVEEMAEVVQINLAGEEEVAEVVQISLAGGDLVIKANLLLRDLAVGEKARADDNADQHGYLEKPKTFEGGHGLGGRTGRGANRGGRSTQNYGTNGGMSMVNHPNSWGKFQGFDGSKKAVVFTGDEMRTTHPGGNTPSWSGDQAAGGWGKPRITMQVGRMMLKQVARAAQVMGDQIDSWGNKKKDGYGWSKQ